MLHPLHQELIAEDLAKEAGQETGMMLYLPVRSLPGFGMMASMRSWQALACLGSMPNWLPHRTIYSDGWAEVLVISPSFSTLESMALKALAMALRLQLSATLATSSKDLDTFSCL